MEKLEKGIINFFKQQNTDLSGKRFLLACSGGKDSMVLAQALKNLKMPFGIAHCNFQLREMDSEKDQDFVEDFCLKNSISCFTKKFQTKKLALDQGKSIQMMARELRYSFFDEISRKHSFDYILTAHHLEDSLETLIINLSRGTGLKGLAGIPSKNGKIIRPLHLSSREEMNAYQKSQNIVWREDKSNTSDNYQRNFIRHHINPLLKKSHPTFEKGVLNSMKNIHQDLELYSFMLKKIQKDICLNRDEGMDLNLEKLESYPSKSSILKYILQPFGFNDLTSIEKSAHSLSGREFESEHFRALINRGLLQIRKKETITPQNYFIEEQSAEITKPFNIRLETIQPEKVDFAKLEKNSAAFDFDKLHFPLEFRRWKEGDRFQPLGMKQTKKLSDFFIDEKVSKFEKSRLWLLCSGNDIIWIIGYRINDLYKITAQTKKVFLLKAIN